MSNFSPLRYPGGKGKLAKYMSEIIAMNALEGGHYAEPFAGGAGVALDLLFTEQVGHIHINDIDPCIYAFRRSAIYRTDELINLIRNVEVCVESWLSAREIKRYPNLNTLLNVGFSTFFLNRTNQSGILNGGIIGGADQKGRWKIDCRFNKEELISRISRIGFFRSRISITNQDASIFISEHVKNIREKTLLYIDPPYYVKGAMLYENHYTHDDHVMLAHTVKNISDKKWIVSYDNVQAIADIYNEFDQQVFDINYSARSYARGSEIMIFSENIQRPTQIYCTLKERQLANAGAC
jgi:DNA adenine methylase